MLSRAGVDGSRLDAPPAPLVQPARCWQPTGERPSRWVWRHAFGEVLIEVQGDEVYVDGQRVVPHGR